MLTDLSNVLDQAQHLCARIAMLADLVEAEIHAERAWRHGRRRSRGAGRRRLRRARTLEGLA